MPAAGLDAPTESGPCFVSIFLSVLTVASILLTPGMGEGAGLWAAADDAKAGARTMKARTGRIDRAMNGVRWEGNRC